jgi:putative Holliday junction resolvase
VHESGAERAGATGPGRCLGIDLGERRIGLACSDRERRVALAHGILERTASHRLDHEAIARLVDELDISLVVVGLPLSLDGTVGPAARAVLSEIEELAARLAVPVMTSDERLTTVEATRQRLAPRLVADQARRGGRGGRAGLSRPGAPNTRHGPRVDDDAAALLLQSYLDRAASS